jgi:hypothetical protein
LETLSKHLDRPSILTLVSTQFYNYTLAEGVTQFDHKTAKAIFTFTGTEAEEQFYLCASQVEQEGRKIPLLALKIAQMDDEDEIAMACGKIARSLERMQLALK